jgi:preprotein translocase subunit Sec63
VVVGDAQYQRGELALSYSSFTVTQRQEPPNQSRALATQDRAHLHCLPVTRSSKRPWTYSNIFSRRFFLAPTLTILSAFTMSGSENKPTHDHYTDLGLPTSATAEDIRAAFRSLAKKHHPDRQGPQYDGDASEFRKVREAYEILSDPKKKAEYDRSRGHCRTASQSSSSASGGGFGDNHGPRFSSAYDLNTGSIKAQPFVRTGQGKFAKSNYWDTHERPPPK